MPVTAELGRRVRKGLIAVGLFAGLDLAYSVARDPRFDGWTDAYTWPQLFLSGPVLFCFCIMAWQMVCIAGGLLSSLFKRKPPALVAYRAQDRREDAAFWIHDSARILALYAAACVIGDLPMLWNYLAEIRQWRFHWWWSDVVVACLLVTTVAWWILERSAYPNKTRPSA